MILNLGSNNLFVGVTSDHQKTGIYMQVITVAKLIMKKRKKKVNYEVAIK